MWLAAKVWWHSLTKYCIYIQWYLGKPVFSNIDEFPENFQKGGGGVISDPKKFVSIFFALETAILVINFREKLRKGGRGGISGLKN